MLAAPAIDVLASNGTIEERAAELASVAPRAGLPPLRVVTRAAECAPDHPRVVVGACGEAHVAALCAALGVTSTGPARFSYAGQLYERADDTLIATFADPERPGLPVTLFLGNDFTRLVLDLEDPLWGWRPNVRVLRAGELVFAAPLTLAGELVAERADRRAARRLELRRSYVPLTESAAPFTGFRARDVSEERARAYVAEASGAARRAASWAAPGSDVTGIELVLHAYVEDQRDWTGAVGFARWNAHNASVHALLAGGAPDDGGAAVARGIVERALGRPVEEWIAEGAGIAFARVYLGRELAGWQSWLAAADLVLPARELVDARAAERISPHVLAPQRAALVQLLLDTRGAGVVRELWSGTQRLVVDDELESALRARFAELAARGSAAHATALEKRRKTALAPFAGLGLAEPAFARDDGYGTRSVVESLAAARAAGASGISVTSFLANAPDPAPFAGPGAEARFDAREGDAALVATLARARASGLATVLLPHFLSAEGGTFVGTWLRSGEADWRAYFEDYRRFAAHYAALAELGGADVLSLGGGLLETTRFTVEGRRGDVNEIEWKRAGWSRVVAAARGEYTGVLTFTAGSAEEAQKIGFWDDLDAVAIEPRVVPRTLRGRPAADVETAFAVELESTWATGLMTARAHGKRLYVVGASFPGAPEPDGARAGPGSAVEDLRVDAFDRLGAFAQRDPKDVGGVLLGRWSTSRSDLGAGARDHLLAGEHGFAAARAALARLGPALERAKQ